MTEHEEVDAWYTERLRKLKERTAALEQEKELRERANGWQPLSTFPPDKYDYKVEVGWWHENEWHPHVAYKLRSGPWISAGRAIATPDWWRELTPPPMPPGVK